MLDGGNIKSASGCDEPDYEAQLKRLFKKQDVVVDFLKCVREMADVFGVYSLEKSSFMETVASAYLIQHTVGEEINSISQKIDKKKEG